jgi:hypothetical protein
MVLRRIFGLKRVEEWEGEASLLELLAKYS